jgi:hypothetical protein
VAKANRTAETKTTTETFLQAVSIIEACIVVNDTRDSVDRAPDISFPLEAAADLIREVLDAADGKQIRAKGEAQDGHPSARRHCGVEPPLEQKSPKKNFGFSLRARGTSWHTCPFCAHVPREGWHRGPCAMVLWRFFKSLPHHGSAPPCGAKAAAEDP